MNNSFTKKQEEYISKLVDSGDFKNSREVISDVLHLHSIYREKVIKVLHNEIEKGWNSPDSSITTEEIIASKRD